MSANGSKSLVEVSAKDLQGPGVVFCPNPKMPLWSNQRTIEYVRARPPRASSGSVAIHRAMLWIVSPGTVAASATKRHTEAGSAAEPLPILFRA